MKLFLKNLFKRISRWLLYTQELDLEGFEKLESKKYQKRGGFYGE